jgi:hypothetical protein
MFRSRRAIASAVAGLVAASTAAVVLDTAPASAAAPNTIKVFITQNRIVHMPSAMHPGVHKFVIRSANNAAFQILRTRPGYSDQELADDITAGLDQGNLTALKRFERNVTLLGGVSSAPRHRGVMFVRLPRGHRYIAIDTNAQANLVSKFHHFNVVGQRVAGAMPSTRSLKAIHDMDWAPRPKHIPSSGLLGFTNASKDNHFIVLVRLKAGKTMRDWRHFVNAVKNGQNPGPPPVNFNVGLNTGAVSPGHRMVFRYQLPRGRYVLTCFWPDAEEGGLPHAFLGMYRKLVVR